MENNIQVFTNEQFGRIRIRVLDGNEIEINLEDAARGLGFTRTEIKGGKTYTSILWHRVKQYLEDVGFRTEVCEGGYIPEPVFYMLAIKATNDTAKKFQRWIAYEVVPSIRKHGAYISPAAEITPEFLRNIADALEAEKRKVAQLEETVAVQTVQIAELQPKASYYDVVLNCKDLVAISKIAKDYGMDAVKMNKLLHELGVQFKQGKTWLLYAKYAGLGWTSTKTQTYNGSDGEVHSKVHTYWTQKGRLGLYELLKKHGLLPLIEREHDNRDSEF